MQVVTKDKFCFSLSAKHKAVAVVKAGEIFTLQIEDCYGGMIRSIKDKFSHVMLEAVNPATGPVYIEGADVGDILCVHIKSIVTRPYGIACFESGVGPLKNKVKGLETCFIPIKGKELIFDKIKIPFQPSIGFIATAPIPGKSFSSTSCDDHGGNISCKEIQSGVNVYLPVNVKGALLAIGNLHAYSSDGEVAGCSVEVSGEVVVSATPMKIKMPTPIVETKSALHFLASARDLNVAEEKLIEKVYSYLCENLKFKANEAIKIMGFAGALGICSIYPHSKTLRFSIPKKVLESYGWNFLKKKRK